MNLFTGTHFINPVHWGPCFWSSIESVILSMDTKDEMSKEYVYLFLYTLQNVLPCPDCREHYQDYFSKYNVKEKMSRKEDLLKWIFQLRVKIKKDNKERFDQTFPQYLKSLEHKFFPENSRPNTRNFQKI